MRYGGVSRQSGFTLVELSIVIIIVGLLTAGGLAVGASMVERAAYIDTQKLITQLQRSVKDFYIVNGRLPCVAPLDDAPGSSGFGVENPNCASSAAVPGGTFREGSPVVRIGMIPVRTLGLSDSAASDKYGNRIVYAVSEQLTDANQFGAQNGGIIVRDMNDNPVLSNAAFYIGSSGRDHKGAYSYSTGNIPTGCGASDNLDVDNCDFSDVVFRDAPFNNGDVEDKFFDDITAWTPKFHLTGMNASSDTLWAANGDANLYNVGTDGNTANTNVGIGVVTPAAKLHVAGNAGALRLQGNDHVYMEMFAKGAATRSGYLGYGSSANNDLTLRNEIANGDILINPNGGNVGIGTTTPTQGKLHVTGGPIYAGDMWLGQSGATNTAPDIQCGVDCLIAAEANMRFGIDGDGNGGNNFYFYKGGLNTTTATYFASLTPASHLYLGRDNTSGAVIGSAAYNMALSLQAADSYNDGAAIFLYGRNNSAGGQVRLYTTEPAGSTEGHRFLRRRNDTTTSLFVVRSNGNAWLMGGLNENSDKRLKEDITPLDNVLDKLEQLNGVSFRWNGKDGHGDTTSRQIGVLAQDVQKVFPELVEEGDSGYLAVEKAGLIAPLIEAVKLLRAENTALRADMEKVKANGSVMPTDSDALRPLDIILLLGLGVMILLYARNRKA